MQVYDVSITKVEKMERLISKNRKGFGVLFKKCGPIQFINEIKTSDKQDFSRCYVTLSTH